MSRVPEEPKTSVITSGESTASHAPVARLQKERGLGPRILFCNMYDEVAGVSSTGTPHGSHSRRLPDPGCNKEG